MSAGKHKLGDLQRLLITTRCSVMAMYAISRNSNLLLKKWHSFGFEVYETDGHDINTLRKILLDKGPDEARPKVVICHTVKGKVPFHRM